MNKNKVTTLLTAVIVGLPMTVGAAVLMAVEIRVILASARVLCRCVSADMLLLLD
jgi:hypothetical protein